MWDKPHLPGFIRDGRSGPHCSHLLDLPGEGSGSKPGRLGRGDHDLLPSGQKFSRFSQFRRYIVRNYDSSMLVGMNQVAACDFHPVHRYMHAPFAHVDPRTRRKNHPCKDLESFCYIGQVTNRTVRYRTDGPQPLANVGEDLAPETSLANRRIQVLNNDYGRQRPSLLHIGKIVDLPLSEHFGPVSVRHFRSNCKRTSIARDGPRSRAEAKERFGRITTAAPFRRTNL